VLLQLGPEPDGEVRQRRAGGLPVAVHQAQHDHPRLLLQIVRVEHGAELEVARAHRRPGGRAAHQRRQPVE
jgi:hypothetical protein